MTVIEPSSLGSSLARAAVKSQTFEGFLESMGQMLHASSLKVKRIFVSLQTIHPTFRARTYLWKHKTQRVTAVQWPHGLKNRPGYYHSPDYHVHSTQTELRVNNLGQFGQHTCDLYDQLKTERYTDYLIVPLHFSDGTINTLSIATKDTDGFTADALDGFRNLTDMFVLILERYAALETRNAALDTYLGRNVAREVLKGHIRSGYGEEIDAAILFADLDDFTRLSRRLDSTRTVRLLNAYFDCLTGPIEAHGGHILKFIGDAVLAFFPTLFGAKEPSPLAAILAIRRRLAELNQARTDWEQPVLSHAVCVNFGRILYGNVGSSERLEFTIIGDPVNFTARGVEAAKSHKIEYAFTRSFVDRFGSNQLTNLGPRVFKGLDEPVELFSLNSEAYPDVSLQPR